jgi:hypothetical protein
MQPRFYRIQANRFVPWGDYGSILQHGMTGRLGRVDGLLSLERTGPYMPPITFPGIGDVVLSSGGRALLEYPGWSGFTFQPVHKTRIVNIPWHEWDLTTFDPPVRPASGEPENYILKRRHDTGVAGEMGDIWELVVPRTARIGRESEIVKSWSELYIELNSWNGAEVFRGVGAAGVLVVERVKSFLEEHVGDFVIFEEFSSR